MKARVTISRISGGTLGDTINISFEDCASHIEFASVALSLKNFALAITGLACQKGELEVRGLQWVGKKRITEERSIECPLKTYERKKLEEWLKNNAQEEGWIVSTYLGSQNSIEFKDDKRILHYHVTKYVEDEERKK